jgi:hypothetical protein
MYVNINLKKAIESFLEKNPWAYEEMIVWSDLSLRSLLLRYSDKPRLYLLSSIADAFKLRVETAPARKIAYELDFRSREHSHGK